MVPDRHGAAAGALGGSDCRRPISIRTTPEDNLAGRPRANDPDNAQLDPTHVIPEPLSLTTTYEYDACSCGKPVRILEVETGREVTFTYDPAHGRVLTRTEVNPSNAPGQPATVTYTYTYTRGPAGSSWSALHLESITGPDGRWDWQYEWQQRADPDHGYMPKKVTLKSPAVTRPGAGLGLRVQTESHFNVSESPYYHATALKGQVVYTVDSDGVPTQNTYGGNGYLSESVVNPGMGALEVKTTYLTDDWGRTVQIVEEVGSALERTTTINPDVFRRPNNTSTVVDGVPIETFYHYDRWGNLAVVRRTNKTSAGGEPDAHGGTAETARPQVRDEFHFAVNQLQAMWLDRRPLDRDSNGPTADAADARMQKTVYLYDAMDRLIAVGHPNGGSTELTYDGYGTLYRVRTLSPDGSQSVVSKSFVDASLNPVRLFRGSATLQLWTVLQRNLAGMVTQLTEPVAASAPQGYDQGSLGGAVHLYTWDPMRRLLEEQVLDGPALLARTEYEYDELGRRVVQRQHVLGAGSGTAETTWLFEDGKATHLQTITYPGSRQVSYQYDGLGRPISVTDSLPANPDQILYDYYVKSWQHQRTTRKLWDGDPSVAAFQSIVTEYVRDSLGRIREIRERGNGTQPAVDDLVHRFTYYTLGFTESYTDPENRVEKYLPDALGRLVQRAKIGPGTAAILNDTVFTDWTTDGRTTVQRFDDKGNETRTHRDFAGRLFLVQNPGADYADEPSQATGLHKALQMLGVYDDASRLTDLYAADSVHTRFFYDGPGRLLVRETPSAGLPDVSYYASRDVYRRDALGRIFRASSHYGALGPSMATQVVVDFQQDSLGRMHLESYLYGGAGPNAIDVASTWAGGDPFRTGLSYQNHLGAGLHDLSMAYTRDALGRLSELEWQETGGALDLLAGYQHMGSAISHKEVHYGQATGLGDFAFDAFGRISRIDHVLQGQTQPFSAFDYVYDRASNLLKEIYDKQGVAPGAGVGDRFTYDDYNRLSQAWMGVDQATMDLPEEQLDPGTSGYVKLLTWQLDDANNRQSVTTRYGPAGYTTVQGYTTQDAAHPQGPSNRYQSVGAAVLEYDDRGNTTFDGNFYYVYDHLNRLSEVYTIQETAGATGSSTLSGSSLSPGTLSTTTWSVQDMAAIRATRQTILQGVRGGLPEILQRNGDPTFAASLRRDLPAGTVSSSSSLTGATTGSSTLGAGTSGSEQLVLVAIYQYDAFERRVLRVVIGQGTWMYAWDGWQEVQELAALDEGQGLMTRPVQQYVWGDELDELVALRSFENGAWAERFVAEGGAHCPVRLLDATGNVLEVQEYDPYGKASFFQGGAYRGGVSGFGNPFQWKGHRYDPETGLLYVRYRYYSMALGRFLTVDPIGVWGDSGNFGNGYTYGRNAPLGWDDRFGLQGATNLGDTYQVGDDYEMDSVHLSDWDWFLGIGWRIPADEGNTNNSDGNRDAQLGPAGITGSIMIVSGFPMLPKSWFGMPRLGDASKSFSPLRWLMHLANKAGVPYGPGIPASWPCGGVRLLPWLGRVIPGVGWVLLIYDLGRIAHENSPVRDMTDTERRKRMWGGPSRN